jgi:CRISPR-associated protein Csh1
MIHQLEKIARQAIPDRRTATGTLDFRRDYKDKGIVFIDFTFDDITATFTGITTTEFKTSDAALYLWQPYSANGSPKFPTLQIFNKKAPKDLYDEATGQLSLSTSKKAKKLLKCLTDFPALKAIADLIEKSPDIAGALDAKIQGVEEFLLSLRINDKMVGESPYFAEKIISLQGSDIKPEYFTDGGKSHLAQEKLCSITLEKTEVFGYASLYNFYAPKTYPSVVAGGFDSTKSWRNFPTSKNGILALEKAKAFVEESLRFRFCGYDYFLLPTPVLNTPNDEFSTIASDFNKFALTDESKQQSSLVELDIISALAEQQNAATYTLFFFEQNKAEFKILASIDDVFPSYMRRVYEARQAIEALDIFQNLSGKDKTTYNLRFDFRLVQHFFPSTKMDGDNTHHFLNIVRSVFMQKQVDYAFILQAIMRRVRKSAVNSGRFDLDALKGYMFLSFLAKLHLLHQYSTQTMSKPVNVDAPIEGFFKEHEGYFDYGSPLKRAVFLEGVLAQKLLNIQQVERGSQPFFSRLNGLNINRKIFERILPEIHTKLTEYDKFFPNYRRVSEAISAYTVACETKDWKLSDDEYSFYFTLGMSLAKQFYPKESSTETTSNEEKA